MVHLCSDGLPPTPHWEPGAKSKDGRGSWMCADEPAPVQVFLSPKPS